MDATVIDRTEARHARDLRGRRGHEGRVRAPGHIAKSGRTGRAEAALAELDPSGEDGLVPAPGLLGRGAEIVAGFLRFCETGDNARVVKRLLRVSADDPGQAALIDAYVVESLVRPYVERVRLTDAWPRARLAFSQLIGLAVSRYILREEPIASADHATLAAWAGPAIDYFLRSELGGETVRPGGEALRRSRLSPAGA